MRNFAYLGLLASLVLPVIAHAAEIDENGARQIEQQISRFVPAITSGVVKIVPAGDHYEARIDIEPIILSLERPVHISEMTPIVQKLTPRADGLWDVAANGSMWLIGDHFFGAEPRHFQLHVGDYQFSQIFDPAVRYARTSTFALKDVNFTNNAYGDRDAWSAKDYTVTTHASDLKDGVGSVSGDGVWHDFAQTKKVPELRQEFKFVAKSGGEHVEANNVDLIGVGKLVHFWMRTTANRYKHFTPAQWKELTAILRKHAPLLDEYRQDATAEQVTLDIADARLSAEKMTIGIALENSRDDTALSVSVAAQQISTRPSALPKGYTDAIPEECGVSFRFSGFNFRDNLESFAAAAQQNMNQARLTQEFYKRFLKDGRMRFEIKDTFARSKHYDVQVSGWLSLNPNNPADKGEGDVTVTARHLDDTVKFLQANANSVPQFGQASFLVLMAKGLGKQQPDGSITWIIKRDSQGKRTINGRAIPG